MSSVLAPKRPAATRQPETGPVALARQLSQAAAPLDLFERLAAARTAIAGPKIFTTSFGLEDQVIGHAIFSQGLDIELVTLDTGRLFPETHEVWAETERRYGRRIRAIVPDRGKLETLIRGQGSDGFRASVEARRACCHVRKVAPLNRALAGAAGWITGLRADQSEHRADVAFARVDAARGLIKISPLYDWTRSRAKDFAREFDLPVNTLHKRGFLSIGCAPCTRAIEPDEPERAGRWWWENDGKTECGLHANPLHPAARAAQKAAQS